MVDSGVPLASRLRRLVRSPGRPPAIAALERRGFTADFVVDGGALRVTGTDGAFAPTTCASATTTASHERETVGWPPSGERIHLWTLTLTALSYNRPR
jgi:hypothetical protein